MSVFDLSKGGTAVLPLLAAFIPRRHRLFSCPRPHLGVAILRTISSQMGTELRDKDQTNLWDDQRRTVPELTSRSHLDPELTSRSHLEIWRRCAPLFFRHMRKTKQGGIGGQNDPPPHHHHQGEGLVKCSFLTQSDSAVTTSNEQNSGPHVPYDLRIPQEVRNIYPGNIEESKVGESGVRRPG